MANDIIAFCVTQYQALGPIFRVRALGRQMIVLAGPEANSFITQEGADKFSSYETWTSYGLELGAAAYIQNMDGEQHLLLRKLMKRAYSPGMMRSNLPRLVDIAQTVIGTLPVGTELPALRLFRLIVTEQLGQTLANHPVSDDLDTLIRFIGTALKVHVTRTLPAIALRLPGYQHAKRRVIELGREIIAEHQATTRPQPDLIDDLLEARQTHPALFNTEGALLEAALGPFTAGLDTVANECTFMLYALLEHPVILQQCVQEADALFADGVPQADQLRSLDVIHKAMMETLRRYSIAPGVTRTAAKSFTFAGYPVTEGESLFLACTVSHFLPELFPEPYTFDIQRYSEPRNEHKQRGAFSPFGIGTHTCLGAGAAEVQMMLVMATVLHLLRLESLTPGQSFKIKQDPTPTLGARFRVRIAERRHQVAIDASQTSQVAVEPES
jgi:cytochrome P450